LRQARRDLAGGYQGHRRAVRERDDEVGVFGWIIWPSRGARDEVKPQIMTTIAST
jgi:uncharacterized protein YbaA (DUF1428 family)